MELEGPVPARLSHCEAPGRPAPPDTCDPWVRSKSHSKNEEPPEVGQGRDEKRPRPRSGRAKRGSGPEPWAVGGSDRWVQTRESETLRASALCIPAPPGLNSGDSTHACAQTKNSAVGATRRAASATNYHLEL
ncbi:hypothetical protein MRX96_013665 [Rhipicephalus microplus]